MAGQELGWAVRYPGPTEECWDCCGEGGFVSFDDTEWVFGAWVDVFEYSTCDTCDGSGILPVPACMGCGRAGDQTSLIGPWGGLVLCEACMWASPESAVPVRTAAELALFVLGAGDIERLYARLGDRAVIQLFELAGHPLELAA